MRTVNRSILKDGPNYRIIGKELLKNYNKNAEEFIKTCGQHA